MEDMDRLLTNVSNQASVVGQTMDNARRPRDRKATSPDGEEDFHEEDRRCCRDAAGGGWPELGAGRCRPVRSRRDALRRDDAAESDRVLARWPGGGLSRVTVAWHAAPLAG